MIESVNNEHIKNICKLKLKKHRDEENKFLIEGYHLIEEALKENILEEVFILNNETNTYEIKTTIVSEKVMKKLSNMQNTNIVGLCKKRISQKIGNKVLILDKLQDPGNVGTIIRSAVAFDVDTIIITPNSVDIYNEKVLRASQGMFFKINFLEADIQTIIPLLKKEGHTIIGSTVTESTPLKNLENHEKYVLIVGNEGQGLSNETLNLCDIKVNIEMSSNCESLNVGIATSIILYEMSR